MINANNEGWACLFNNKLVFQFPLRQFPLSWRRADGRKALVGEHWCSLDYPWIVRHVPALPEGRHMYLFNWIQKHTSLSCHYSAWTCRGLQKLIGHYKYLDAGPWARAFPVLLPVHAWAIEERGNKQLWLWGSFLRDIIKLSAVGLPITVLLRASGDQLRIWATSPAGDWTPSARCMKTLVPAGRGELWNPFLWKHYLFI